MSRFIFPCLVFLILFAGVDAKCSIDFQPIIDVEANNTQLIDPTSIYYYRDDQGLLEFKDVINCFFRKVDSRIPNFGYTQSAIWIRLKVRVPSTERRWSLVIENPTIESVTAFAGSGRAIYRRSKNSVQSIHYAIPLNKTGDHEVFIRLKSKEPMVIPMKIMDATSRVAWRYKIDLWQGIFFGIILSVLFYNLVIFFTLYEKRYLYYVFYSICISLTFAHFSGYLVQWIGVHAPVVNELAFFNSLSAIAVILFLFEFLGRTLSDALKIPGKIFIGIFSIAFVLCCGGDVYYANIITQAASMLTGLYLLTVGCISLLKIKYRPARFFLAAWSVFISAAIIFILKDFGILPYNLFTQHGIQVGCAIEAILLSLALSDKINYMHHARESARQKEQEAIASYNDLISKENSILKNAVRRRTEELERVNRLKDKFFSIVAHDLRNPLYLLLGFLDLFRNSLGRSLSTKDMVEITEKLESSVQKTVGLTENLLTWARSQMQLDEVMPVRIELDAEIHECIYELHHMLVVKEISVVYEPAGLCIFADKNQFRFIFRNVVSNAIKFSRRGEKINIGISELDTMVQIAITDYGVGMTEEAVQTLFDISVKKGIPGTEGEEGSGLGLMLCKEFIDRNKGTIDVTTTLGKGTTFILSLPKDKNNLRVASIEARRALA